MELDLAAEDWPQATDWEALTDRAIACAASVEPALANARLQLSILLTSDAQVHALNSEWRGRDRPTNVLSFPMMEPDALRDLAADGPPEMLGDIALARETCTREADEKGIALADHVAHLIVHGLLHLAGHDHVDSDAQADAMEALEIAALAQMGIADPYGDRN